MGKKRKTISHEEIWDDSALLDSWDAALQEYQLYHSIHARGERVEDVLRDAEDSQEVVTNSNGTAGKLSSSLTHGRHHSEDVEDGEIEEGQVNDSSFVAVGAEAEGAEVQDESAANQHHKFRTPTPPNNRRSAQAAHAVPDLLTSGVQDDGLKNLMMSWYYAGYYSGLYESRQQSGSVSVNPHNNGHSAPSPASVLSLASSHTFLLVYFHSFTEQALNLFAHFHSSTVHKKSCDITSLRTELVSDITNHQSLIMTRLLFWASCFASALATMDPMASSYGSANSYGAGDMMKANSNGDNAADMTNKNAVDMNENNTMDTNNKNAMEMGSGSGETVVDISVVGVSSYAGGDAPVQQMAQPPMAKGMVHKVIVGGQAGLVFSPNSITAAAGDMVEFTFMSQNHTVTQSTFAKPCVKMQGGVDSLFLPNPNNTISPPPTYMFQVKDTQPAWFYCKQKTPVVHCGMGMTFSINPAADKTHDMFTQTAKEQNGTAASGSASMSNSATST
ncbi:MAG: hypothetical protein Q9196_005053, partial [Gyalolechia fulgens]